MLTRIAPIAEVAYWTMTHSYRLGDQMPTRSPFLTPRAMSPQATSSHWATSSPYVARYVWCAATRASRSPRRAAGGRRLLKIGSRRDCLEFSPWEYARTFRVNHLLKL